MWYGLCLCGLSIHSEMSSSIQELQTKIQLFLDLLNDEEEYKELTKTEKAKLHLAIDDAQNKLATSIDSQNHSESKNNNIDDYAEDHNDKAIGGVINTSVPGRSITVISRSKMVTNNYYG